MKNTPSNRPAQLAFVEVLKRAAPLNINLAEEIASLFEISLDSVYRRMRGETDFSLEEVVALCDNFNIPLEDALSPKSKMVSFRANDLSNESQSFAAYLKVLYSDLRWVRQWENAEIIYAAEDLPVFYHFFFPRLARFKMVYWNKSILGSVDLKQSFVEDIQIPDSWREEVPKIQQTFLEMPSTEIWHEDTLKSTFRQLEYYASAGYFKDINVALEVVDEIEALVGMLKAQAIEGKKYNPIKKEFTDTPYELYISDVMIGTNCVFLRSSGQNASYLGYNTFNFIQTKNEAFNRQSIGWLENLITKSEKVSGVSEKNRNRYFAQVALELEQLRKRISP
ncbi:MAG: hypothetical protein NBV77_06360 [Bacteroidia bacterium]|nr:hypothetical protein [Bacteroidia bacterium]